MEGGLELLSALGPIAPYIDADVASVDQRSDWLAANIRSRCLLGVYGGFVLNAIHKHTVDTGTHHSSKRVSATASEC